MKRVSKYKNKNSSLFKDKNGVAESPTNAAAAAVLILLVTVALVLYILFIPPADRERLLNGDTPGNLDSTGSYSSLLGTSILKESPGKITYVEDNNIEHPLSSFRIYTKTDAQIIHEVAGIEIKNSAFEKKTNDIPFNIQKDKTEKVYLAFNVKNTPLGSIMIYVNGYLLFEGVLKEGSNDPIAIPLEYLNNMNTIHLKAASPGFAFWRVNEYKLENVRITGDVTNNDHSFHMQKFYMVENEMNNLKSATLEFYPDCDAQNVNNIIIEINRQRVFEGIPDCLMLNKLTIGKEILEVGENNLEFFSNSGSYIIDRVNLDVNLIEPNYPMYYFDLNEDLFTNTNEDYNFCGRVDGVCPSGCREYEDKDCCFAESRKNYWCDIKTNNVYDRCVGVALAEYSSRCPSGYEDIYGEPPESLENSGICGDDTDDFCPAGCSKYYDKDCCFAESENNYWCSDIPFTGLESTCTPVVTNSECNACPQGYYNNDKKKANCPGTETEVEGDETLKADINVVLKIDFTGESWKELDFIINGEPVHVNTYYLSYSKVIDEQVRSGVNSLEIKPYDDDINIAQLQIKIE